ncbi:hypothetical protein AALP_AA5G076400 [Arabis alpina]|uniref:Uncharacterized protein n=1 Tax=Arabis alpina TaxID=50452 RepID=A0A087GVK7_ARAAL|nr:hypothetical protein AALP_AA5G076400 [Arabis alpina]
MADVLRQLLDSGRISDESCLSVLRGVGIGANGLPLPYRDGWTSEEDDEEVDQTLVTRSYPMNGASFRVFTQLCRIKPEKPGEERISLLAEQAIDDSYKGCIPNFLSQPRKDDDCLRFYEVQEQDICENDWLRLYSDFALYARWSYTDDGYKSCLPVEIKKIVVETCETHREPRLKLKSRNAIFHIRFSAKGRDYTSVVRRTTDGITGHLILEINTCVDEPNMD